MCSELIANDKPLLVHFNDRWYVPVIGNYSESDFGGPFATQAEYQDPWLRQQIEQHGWALWAPVRFGANTINFATTTPFPSPPSAQNWLGTDANGGDVLARILYGTRISLLFGLMLTIFSSVMGVVAGAVQGYYGGKIDLWGQRVIEVWSGMPTLFLIILLSSVVQPGFWWLLGITVLFGWMALVGVVRAEFLRTPQFRLHSRRAGAWRERPGDHLPPHAAQRGRGNAHLPAVYSVQLHHHPHLAGFSWFRATAGFPVARRTAAAGQKQPAGAVVRHRRLSFRGRAAVAADFYWRSRRDAHRGHRPVAADPDRGNAGPGGRVGFRQERFGALYPAPVAVSTGELSAG
ncbi:hypothetical protein L1887_46362 [Cichorium endivia]|nr:hypothetical protein L1887_46362 [Cichorium endivia]